MAKVDAGAAVISMEAQDHTGPAFTSVNENFDRFKNNLATFEDNIKPFQEVMKGGVAAGGLLTGIGAAIDKAGALSSAMQNAAGSLAQLQSVSGETSGPLEILSDILSSPGFAQAGAIFTGIAVGLMTAFEATKQIAIAAQAARAIYIAVNGAVYAHAAAQTAAMAATTAATVATSAETTAKVAGSAADALATTTEVVSAGATTASTTATVGHTVALGYYAWACNAASVATNYLSASLGLNPFTIWLVAITAIVAGLAALGYGIYKFCTSGKEKAKTLREISEEANKIAEANKKMADSIKTSNDLIIAKYERLKQIAGKKYQSRDELKEAEDITVDLRTDYNIKGGYSQDEGWKKITKRDDLELQIAAQAKIRNNLYAQLRALKAADNGALNEEEKTENNKRQNEIELELMKMRADAEKEVEERVKKRIEAEKAAADAKAQVVKAGQDLQKTLQREIDDQNKTALEKEQQALKDKLDARVQELKLAVEKKEITKKEASEEWQALNAIIKLRKQQIKETFDQTKENADLTFYNVYEAKEQDRADKKRYAAQDEKISNQISENPFEAMNLIGRQLQASSSALTDAQKRLDDKMAAIKSGAYSGTLDDQKTAVAALEKERDGYLARVEKMTQFSKNAETEIQKGVHDMLAKTKTAEATPIDAARKGSADAFKQAMENRARAVGAKSPEAAETAKLADQLKKQYDEQKRKKDEEIKISKEIVTTLKEAAV